MRGSGKILMAALALVLVTTPLALAKGEPRSMPTDKTTGTVYTLIRFDGVIYRVVSEIPCDITFERIDEEHHRVFVATIPDGVISYCEVEIQWGDFPPVVLDIVLGGNNSWLLGIETGYAEK